MPVGRPPQQVVDAFIAGTTEHVRRVDIYESNGQRLWKRDVPFISGSISVDQTRDERRSLDLTIDNTSGEYPNDVNELWYDKIIKVYRGVRLKNPDRKPRIGIFTSSTTYNSEPLRAALGSIGFPDVEVRYPSATLPTLDQVSVYDIVIMHDLAKTETHYSTMLPQLYQSGVRVLHLGEVSNSLTSWLNSAGGSTARETVVYDNTTPAIVQSGGFRYGVNQWSPFSYSELADGETITYSHRMTPGGGGWFRAIRNQGGIAALAYASAQFSPVREMVFLDFPLPEWIFRNPEMRNMLRAVIGFLNPIRNMTYWDVQVGEFMIDRIKEANFPKHIQITGRDYTKKGINSKYLHATQFDAGFALEEVIASIAGAANITKRILPVTGIVVNRDFFFERGTTRWEAMKELCTAFNYELFFDATGYLVMRPMRDPATDLPVYVFETGRHGTVVSYDKSSSDTRISNVVLVTGESSDQEVPPVYGIAKNEDPNSPTSIQVLGERVYEYSSSYIETFAQAQELADTFLEVNALEEYEVDFSALMMPWLEVGDIIEFNDNIIDSRFVATERQINSARELVRTHENELQKLESQPYATANDAMRRAAGKDKVIASKVAPWSPTKGEDSNDDGFFTRWRTIGPGRIEITLFDRYHQPVVENWNFWEVDGIEGGTMNSSTARAGHIWGVSTVVIWRNTPGLIEYETAYEFNVDGGFNVTEEMFHNPGVDDLLWVDASENNTPKEWVDFGTVPVTNLVTNPRGRKTSGTVVVRENLCARPSLISDGLTSQGTSSPIVIHDVAPPVPLDDSNVTQITFLSGTPGSFAASRAVASSFYIQPGVTVTISVWIYNRPSWLYVYPTGSYGMSALSRLVEGEASGWGRYAVTGTNTTSSTWNNYLAFMMNSNASEDRSVLIGRVVYERADAPLPYFDGDYSPDPDLTPEWTGTPGASTSRLVGQVPLGNASPSSQAISYVGHEDNKTYHRYILTTPAPVGINFNDFGNMGNKPAVTLGFKARSSKTLTVIPRLAMQRQPEIILPANEWVDIIFTFPTMGLGQNVYNGLLIQNLEHRPGDVIDIADRIVIEGTYTGPFFDGSMPGVEWNGEPDNSTSSYTGPHWATSGDDVIEAGVAARAPYIDPARQRLRVANDRLNRVIADMNALIEEGVDPATYRPNRFLFSSLTIPLGLETMSATAKRVIKLW